jgi:NAD(P)-dependent dehydrogenase (short-subunit alcohol dehydrogenase family)
MSPSPQQPLSSGFGANTTAREVIGGVSATIDAFAARFGDRPLHLLINNAGIIATPLSRDARGLESQLAVNHVGHFRLFARLVPALRRAQGRASSRSRRAVTCARRSTSRTPASSTARTTR